MQFDKQNVSKKLELHQEEKKTLSVQNVVIWSMLIPLGSSGQYLAGSLCPRRPPPLLPSQGSVCPTVSLVCSALASGTQHTAFPVLWSLYFSLFPSKAKIEELQRRDWASREASGDQRRVVWRNLHSLLTAALHIDLGEAGEERSERKRRIWSEVANWSTLLTGWSLPMYRLGRDFPSIFGRGGWVFFWYQSYQLIQRH